MTELKIVAVLIIKDAYKEELADVLKTVINASRKEAGCISYDLYQDIKNPLKFTFIETWKNQQAIDEHNATDHFKTFVSAIEGKIESLTIDFMKQLY